MQFELSPALIDEILFFMEDQDGEFLVDTQEGFVISADDDEFDVEAEGRYISLPEWDSSEGFRMMEHFAATLHNALVREELSAALDRGRGVFRAFKNTLSRYPEIEKLWYAYKEREMKRVVIAWYNALRESWGLELIGEEPEDITGLALEDFYFREAQAADMPRAEELHKSCIGENCCTDLLSREWVFPGDISFVALTAGGEFAAYISAERVSDALLRICALETEQEYRGLGLGKALIARLLEKAENIPNITIDLPSGQEFFSRALLREEFKPCVTRYSREKSKEQTI